MKTTKADKWFSLFIRIRDTWEDGYCRCITCGRVLEPKNMDCGHYIKRQHSAARFNEKNCHAQCKHCNAFEQGRDAIYREKLIEMYGEDYVLYLDSCKRTNGRLSSYIISELEKQYKEKAKCLAEQKGIKIW